jgi:hypothetical protein
MYIHLITARSIDSIGLLWPLSWDDLANLSECSGLKLPLERGKVGARYKSPLQKGPSAFCLLPSLSNRWIFVTDKG